MLALKGKKNEKGRKYSELEWNRKKVQNISWNRWDLQKKKIFWFLNVDHTQVYVDWINWID